MKILKYDEKYAKVAYVTFKFPTCEKNKISEVLKLKNHDKKNDEQLIKINNISYFFGKITRLLKTFFNRLLDNTWKIKKIIKQFK